MSNTIVVTSIYSEFWGTEEFRKSVEKVGLPLHNAWKGTRFTGHGETLRYVYEALKGLENDYKYAIYSDGADSYFIKSFTPPDNTVIYSTEKAVWPPNIKHKWEDYYKDKVPESVWMYLNGGGYCGEIRLLIEFFEKYGLNNYKGDINGQKEQSFAFIKAHQEGFPIMLDTKCEYFQTTGFEHDGDFKMGTVGRPNGTFTKIFANTKTGTLPSILHGNGRTDMRKIYKFFN